MVEFKNGKVCRKVTLFGYWRDFDFFSTAQRIEKMSLKILCLTGLTGLHSLILSCHPEKMGKRENGETGETGSSLHHFPICPFSILTRRYNMPIKTRKVTPRMAEERIARTPRNRLGRAPRRGSNVWLITPSSTASMPSP